MKRSGSLLLICIITILGCIDTIEVDLPEDGAGRIVVEGTVERGPDEYQFNVAVRRTITNTDEYLFIIEPADVFLIVNEDLSIPLPNGVSMRMGIDSFHSIYGINPNDIRFRIRAMTADGRVFESDDKSILDPTRAGSIELNRIERQEVNSAENLVVNDYIEVLANTPLVNDKGERLSFLWEVSGVYAFPEVPWTENPFWFPDICYVPDPPRQNQINVVSGADVNTDELRKYKINESPGDFRFRSGYYYTVLQKSIDLSTAEYWKQIASSVQREGTIFDTPPGQIISNIRDVNNPDNEVLGYFYTAGVDTIRYLANRDETGQQRGLCNPGAPMEIPCCDCLAGFPKSSLKKPAYWK